jgi:hypothetical protein
MGRVAISIFVYVPSTLTEHPDQERAECIDVGAVFDQAASKTS